ncbi:hypothetical protein C8R41DRAFT_614983 [Lentinula lateritia]|uniref:Uncharacterized protein n=1 Tax=Lentinula lateritia TaxID=40482 RepID=A0ABQ8V291_9AGAR|nr:hypothetical protein C8R41DRAFT_614983 [Lentinula lateritia]
MRVFGGGSGNVEVVVLHLTPLLDFHLDHLCGGNRCHNDYRNSTNYNGNATHNDYRGSVNYCGLTTHHKFNVTFFFVRLIAIDEYKGSLNNNAAPSYPKPSKT